MADCVFCQIIRGKLPSSKVYEDDKVVAFLDIHPIQPGHTLVVPKVHCNDLLDCDPAVLSNMMQATQKVARAVVQATDAEGFNLGVNNGRVAGQIIFHLHMHVIPRHGGDGLRHWGALTYKEGEIARIADAIRNALK